MKGESPEGKCLAVCYNCILLGGKYFQCNVESLEMLLDPIQLLLL